MVVSDFLLSEHFDDQQEAEDVDLPHCQPVFME